MERNISFQEYYKIILYLYQLKNTLNILVSQLKFISGNLTECQKKTIENIIKSYSLIAPIILLIIIYYQMSI